MTLPTEAQVRQIVDSLVRILGSRTIAIRTLRDALELEKEGMRNGLGEVEHVLVMAETLRIAEAYVLEDPAS